MTLLFDCGPLGPSWQAEGGRLALAKKAGEGERISAIFMDCAWDPKAVLQPGAINAHTHLYSGLAALGMPPPEKPPQNFLEILKRVWWRLDRALDEKLLRATARYAVADALLHGTTTLIDHHESPNFIEGSLDVLADAAQELGARLVVGYGATERNGGADEAHRGLAECERFIRDNTRTFVKGIVAVHASFTVSDNTLIEAGALARSLAVPVHVHVAEDAADVADAHRRGYEGPLERLLALDALPPGSILAHGVHLTEAQVQRAEACGLWLVQNPRSNEANGVGYATALKRSALVALGTDGWPSSMEDEAAALFRLGQAHDSDSQLRQRVAGGFALAQAVFGQRLGELAPGAQADVVARIPGEQPIHVVVGGRRVVANGKFLTGDLEEIQAKAREAAPQLWKRMARVPES